LAELGGVGTGGSGGTEFPREEGIPKGRRLITCGKPACTVFLSEATTPLTV